MNELADSILSIKQQATNKRQQTDEIIYHCQMMVGGKESNRDSGESA